MFKLHRILIIVSIVLVLGIMSSASLAQDGQDPFQASVDDGSLPALADRLPTNPLVVGSGMLLTEADLPDWGSWWSWWNIADSIYERIRSLWRIICHEY